MFLTHSVYCTEICAWCLPDRWTDWMQRWIRRCSCSPHSPDLSQSLAPITQSNRIHATDAADWMAAVFEFIHALMWRHTDHLSNNLFWLTMVNIWLAIFLIVVLNSWGLFFTARCYASAVLAMALHPSVCPSQVGVLLKRLNIGSHKQHHTIPQEFSFLMPKISAKFDRGPRLRGRRMQVGWSKSATFDK